MTHPRPNSNIPAHASLWALLLLVAPLTGCSGSRTDRNNSERREYQGTAERTLADLGARIDSLSDEVKTRTDTTKVQLERKIHDLDGDLQLAKQKAAGLQVAGKERWNELRRDIDAMVARINAGVDTLKVKLRR